jgi:hypothetical protein
LATAAGALLGLGRLIIAHPHRDDASDDDKLTEQVLCIFGVIPDEPRRMCCTPLPDGACPANPALLLKDSWQ